MIWNNWPEIHIGCVTWHWRLREMSGLKQIIIIALIILLILFLFLTNFIGYHGQKKLQVFIWIVLACCRIMWRWCSHPRFIQFGSDHDWLTLFKNTWVFLYIVSLNKIQWFRLWSLIIRHMLIWCHGEFILWCAEIWLTLIIEPWKAIVLVVH